ncbi:LysM peptidoglycan-binding domain-containing protein [Thiohalobacter thiocyanaticus]|uniref:LysM peptidoglycan-binding domain-containing protein n=1 Tax=Thiohalobacter thiocyanaticus TaxID=585455 RepID=A0A426QJ94_9GAMM|nr:LysM peptidoglycan-binding domain-containing protein [Thiohalobacter thiocyanaticus]RRQ21834.1 LysM peptidoglycan-binding domain-containing protein [Thiohalobacter thiocyanaticus]
MFKRLLGILLASTTLMAGADEIALNPQHPERHVVVKGDTLWDISEAFLRDPWLWPEVWYVNPQIENPHLIYPGDVITLVYIDGRPQLRVQRGQRTVRLSPKMRATPLDQAIPTIPIDAIHQFLTRPLVLDEEALDSAGYVLDSADEHIVTGAGDRIYARGTSADYDRYNVFEPQQPYIDPDTGELLGHRALYVGEARIESHGDPSTLQLVETTREVSLGDRLLPVRQEEVRTHFLPRAPETAVEGKIIAVVDGVTQIGQYQVVVINRGEREGLEAGHVLKIQQAGALIRDRFGEDKEQVQLPNEDAGTLLVFRTFDKLSYGLVMEATRAIHLMDIVTNP